MGVSFLASTTLVEALPRHQGGEWSSGARAWAQAGPALAIGVRVPVQPGLALAALAVWQGTELRVEDVGGERDQQSLTLLSGVVEARYAVRAPLVLSGGLGVLSYRGEETGLLADGAKLSPLARLGAGVELPTGGHLLTLRALAEYHRFGTSVLQANGGGDARVVRYGAEAVFSWGGAR